MVELKKSEPGLYTNKTFETLEIPQKKKKKVKKRSNINNTHISNSFFTIHSIGASQMRRQEKSFKIIFLCFAEVEATCGRKSYFLISAVNLK